MRLCRWPQNSPRPNLPPSSSELLSRLTQGTSLRELEAIQEMPGCYYISLPVDHYKASEFPKFDELVDIGYQTRKAWFAEMEASHKLPDLAIPRVSLKNT